MNELIRVEGELSNRGSSTVATKSRDNRFAGQQPSSQQRPPKHTNSGRGLKNLNINNMNGMDGSVDSIQKYDAAALTDQNISLNNTSN